MKKLKAIKAIVVLLLIMLQLLFLGLFSYALILYKGVETFYRIFGMIILIYLFFLFSYLLLRSIKKKNLKAFIIPVIITMLMIGIEFAGYYYLTKIYKAINAYSNENNIYHSSLVTYNTSLKNYKDLNNNTIGIITDSSDIEGNTLPLFIIQELKLEDNNTVKTYDSTLELLYALKDKKVDTAFFSSNYVDMFSTLDGFEEIENQTKVLYTKDKEYKSNEKEIKNETSSLSKPFTMLLIGVDSSKDGVTSGYNADVLLLVTFNPKTLRATLTSVPRDMYLQTACSGSTYRRINTTTWGSSSSCAVETIENLFDVDIDYYAKINFKGVVSLVDAVGGIDVNVPYSLCEQSSSRKWGKSTVFIEKGLQHLNGEQALALARTRHKPNDGSAVGRRMAQYCPTYTSGSRSDYARGKNQMKVILGVVKSATKLTDPNQALDILQKIKKNFQTNIKTNDVLSLYNLGKSIAFEGNTNLINVQRLQLSGKNVWGSIYEPSSKSYPAVTIPYKESIDAIKKEININLGKTKTTSIKKITFDLNKLYEDVVIGSGNFSNAPVNTLKNLSGMSISELKNYAASINKTLNIIDINTKQNVDIYDYSNYSFYSQKEHKDTLLGQLSSITVYVKAKITQTQEVTQ